jgi:hypothetical protein
MSRQEAIHKNTASKSKESKRPKKPVKLVVQSHFMLRGIQ